VRLRDAPDGAGQADGNEAPPAVHRLGLPGRTSMTRLPK
jgi:hypothetical protein